MGQLWDALSVAYEWLGLADAADGDELEVQRRNHHQAAGVSLF
jgi:hypothetical protein